jgi:hypothetical protein
LIKSIKRGCKSVGSEEAVHERLVRLQDGR